MNVYKVVTHKAPENRTEADKKAAGARRQSLADLTDRLSGFIRSKEDEIKEEIEELAIKRQKDLDGEDYGKIVRGVLSSYVGLGEVKEGKVEDGLIVTGLLTEEALEYTEDSLADYVEKELSKKGLKVKAMVIDSKIHVKVYK